MPTIIDGKPYLAEVKELILSYTHELNRDLSFQNLDAELQDIAHKYTEPYGKLLVARVENKCVGIVAFHKLTDDTCEMKRLFVLPEYRKLKLGESLVKEIIESATLSGYKFMVLDTITPLKAAIHLYKNFGFKECEGYYYNPMPDVLYFKKEQNK